MAAGVDGRGRIGRSLRAAPGWAQLGVGVALTAALILVAHLAGVPGRWAPLVIGGALGLTTALVAGAPRRDDPDS